MEQEFELKEEFIQLNQLLKLVGLAQTGGHAKIMVREGDVLCNGEVESRLRYKVRKGDVIEAMGTKIVVK